MSYDLFLRPKAGATVTRKSLEFHFRRRKNYRLENHQAIYDNQDTGVYFSFDLPKRDLKPAGILTFLRRSEPESVAFNLNYFRPHTFGLEAEPEVAALISAFNLDIEDPQFQGMASGPYSREGFLRGWNAGNQFGYQAILNGDRPSQPPRTLPSAKIEEIWNWNLARKTRQQDLGDDIFVPVIMLMDAAGALETVAVWTEVSPILLPIVDSLLLVVDAAQEKLAKLPLAEFIPLIDRYKTTYEDIPCFHLDYDPEDPPQELKAFFTRRRPAPENLTRLSLDQVLDEELLRAVQQSTPPSTMH